MAWLEQTASDAFHGRSVACLAGQECPIELGMALVLDLPSALQMLSVERRVVWQEYDAWAWSIFFVS